MKRLLVGNDQQTGASKKPMKAWLSGCKKMQNEYRRGWQSRWKKNPRRFHDKVSEESVYLIVSGVATVSMKERLKA